jgi:ketosteroid isomerase-like protein
MSRENVEILRRRFDALRKGDMDGFIELTDPNIEWWDRADDPWAAAVHRGRDACMKHLAETTDELELLVEPLEFIDVDDLVVVPVRLVGRGRASGVPFDEQEVNVFRLGDGKVIEVREYRERDEALEAVGLEG